MKHLINNATQGTDAPWVTYDNEGIVHYSGLVVEDPLAALFNGYEAVDLGLITSNGNHLLFAACNVGADKPEEYGKYFMWGDVEGEAVADGAQPTRTYDWANAPYYSGSSSTDYTKYTPTDGKTVLDASDDAAHVIMKGSWRMPTTEEFQELYDNTTCTWVTIDGVNGRKFTASNGNYIFIPASGRCDLTSLINRGTYGYYWSSSLYSSNPNYVYILYFHSGNVIPQDNSNRCNGYSIRGVIELTPEQYQLYLNK